MARADGEIVQNTVPVVWLRTGVATYVEHRILDESVIRLLAEAGNLLT